MSKFIQAKDILKAKNYVQNKFDTNGFLQDVAEYFMSRDINATFTIYPQRFADVPDNDSTEFGSINMEAKKKGYCQCLYPPCFEDTIYADMPGGLEMYRKYYEPCIYIDEPFLKNSVFTLRTLAGYNVESFRKYGMTCYRISLI